MATSYALMLYLSHNQLADSVPIMKWLVTQHKSFNYWSSSQVCVIRRGSYLSHRDPSSHKNFVYVKKDPGHQGQQSVLQAWRSHAAVRWTALTIFAGTVFQLVTVLPRVLASSSLRHIFFFSFQDTLIALEALSEFAYRETNRDFYKMTIYLTGTGRPWGEYELTLNKTNFAELYEYIVSIIGRRFTFNDLDSIGNTICIPDGWGFW